MSIKNRSAFMLCMSVLSLWSLTGCKHDAEIDGVGPEEVLPRLLHIDASIAPSSEGDETKVDIANDGGTFTWTAGDVIAVHSNNGNYQEMVLDSGAGTGSASFSNEFTGTRNHYAIYPSNVADGSNYGNTTLNVILPSAYTINTGMSDWMAYYSTYSPLPMIAVNNEGSALSFKHAGGIFRITLSNVPATTNTITVTMDQNITGSFPVSSPGTAPTIVNTGGSGKTVTFTLSSALTAATSGIVLNIPVPTGDYKSLQVVCKNGSTNLSAATIDNNRSVSRAGGRKLAMNLSASTTRLTNLTLNNITINPGTAQATAMTYSATNLSGADVKSQSGFTVSCTSSDESIATVSYNSSTKAITVTGKKNGSATITATASLNNDVITKTATVTVNDLGSASISGNSTVLTSKSITLTGGLTAGGSSITADSYAWSITSGSGLATLSSTSGSSVTLTAGATAGSVTVQCIATAGTLTKTVTKDITISKASVAIVPQTTGQTDVSSNTNMSLTATVSNYGTTSISSWKWESSANGVATASYTTGTAASNTATVAFAGAGTSTITATVTLSDGTTVSQTYTVYGRTLTITQASGYNEIGSEATWKLTANLSSGATAGGNYSWSSSNTSYVDFNTASTTNEATLKYMGTGTSSISAEVTTSGKARVTASYSVTGVSLSLAGAEGVVKVKKGKTLGLTATFSSSVSVSSLSWQSATTSAVTLTSASTSVSSTTTSANTATGQNEGSSIITVSGTTAKGASCSATLTLTCYDEAGTLAELKELISSGEDCSAYLGWEVNSAGDIAASGVSGTKIGYIGYISANDVDTGVSGSRILVLASSDASTGTMWGSFGTGRGAGDGLVGYNNTNTLQGYGQEAHPAAYAAWNYSASIPSGGSTPAHWFMPTKQQLDNIVVALGGYSTFTTKVGWSSANYWSSTEYNDYVTWNLDSGGNWYGYGTNNGKNDIYYVRACFAY